MFFSILIMVSSCQKESQIINSENQSQFKAADEDDEIYAVVPTVHGQIFMASGQSAQDHLITFEGIDVTYYASTQPDTNGNFTFNNVVAGTYKRKTYYKSSLIHTVDYLVE